MESIDKISRFISLILRHKPQVINVSLDEQGWCNVEELINNTNIKRPHYELTMEVLEDIVNTDTKKRYSFNEDKTKIRANQGHSLSYVKIDFLELQPPDRLYHGTSQKFRASIYRQGIIKDSENGCRNYVHLSQDSKIAYEVAFRRLKKGYPLLLGIDAKRMYEDGYKFYLSENNVWLTDIVPPDYLIDVSDYSVSLNRILKGNDDSDFEF